MKPYFPILLSATLAYTATAQDFEERFAPKKLTNKNLKLTKLNSGGKLSPISDDTSIILESLKGIRLRSKEGDISPKSIQLKGLDLVPGDGVMKQAEFQTLLSSHLNKPMSMNSLNKLTNSIILYYRSQNIPVVDVVLPEQDITNGALQILVIEGRVGEVKVTGNKFFSDKFIGSNVRLNQGDRINSEKLLDDVNWINGNPFLSAQPIFAAGKQTYTTDVLLQVKDVRPWRYYVGYENSGNDLTGTNRYLLGFNMGNVFGLGHRLNYQLTTGDDFSELNAHSLSYVIPLEWRHTLQIHASYVDTSISTEDFDIDGRSKELGVRYSVPLASSKSLEHEVYGGLVWRNLDNALEFGVIPTSSNSTHIGQFEVGYKGSKRHHDGISIFDVSATYSPGGMFGNSSDLDFSTSRTGAESNYVYMQLRLNRLQKLPHNLTWNSELTAQWSNTKLLSSEQISIGGYSSVRGYDERELNGTDSGIILRNELRFPEVSFTKSERDKWQFLLFSDYAYSKAHGDQVTLADGSLADSADLWSAGLGTRLKIGESLTIRADYGFQLKDVESDSSNGSLHLGGIYSF